MTDWVRSIFLMVTVISFLEGILPGGRMKKYLEFIFALTVLGVILSPLQPS